MKSSEVTIKLSMETEFELMNRYGRRCTREGLVMRAIADAVKTPAAKKAEPKPRKKKEKPDDKQVPLACSFVECPWKGDAVPGASCPVCSSELVEVGANAVQA